MYSGRLEDLSSRFEVPNPRNRWDRPLFTIHKDEKLPLDQIKEALFENTDSMQRNQATEIVFDCQLKASHLIILVQDRGYKLFI